jgi:hypothetical protein
MSFFQSSGLPERHSIIPEKPSADDHDILLRPADPDYIISKEKITSYTTFVNPPIPFLWPAVPVVIYTSRAISFGPRI